MMPETSKFFAEFSLRELVKNKLPVAASSPQGPFGRIGGSSAGIRGRNYHQSQSLSMPVHDEFDEGNFIAALSKEVRAQITDSRATITFEGNIEGDFNSSEFYYEYTEGGIKGRIIISGKMVRGTYRMRAEVEEIT